MSEAILFLNEMGVSLKNILVVACLTTSAALTD